MRQEIETYFKERTTHHSMEKQRLWRRIGRSGRILTIFAGFTAFLYVAASLPAPMLEGRIPLSRILAESFVTAVLIEFYWELMMMEKNFKKGRITGALVGIIGVPLLVGAVTSSLQLTQQYEQILSPSISSLLSLTYFIVGAALGPHLSLFRQIDDRLYDKIEDLRDLGEKIRNR